jgi:formate hydrogenlyase transcriptional activator
MIETESGSAVTTSAASGEVEQAFIEAARALTSHLDVARVCSAVLDAVTAVFGATSGWILLHDESEKVLRTMSLRGPGSEAFRDIALPPNVGILGLAFSSRQVVFVPDVQAEHRWYNPARVHASGLRSVFTVPLVHKEKALGVVGLDSPRFGADRPPGPSDIRRLEAFAAQAAVAVANARLYDASERDRRRLRALFQERQQLRQQVSHLQSEVLVAGAFGDILGSSRVFTEALQQATLVAPGDTTVLLLGETGTGKELLARFIHDQSTREKGPFVAVNCAALPEALVESELFGHEKGAFTGAAGRKVGKFEVAHRGTLFLDEIGDLPLEAQAKLLRVLQDGLVQRVGSTAAVQVDVRVIAATNQDLEAAIAVNRFRSDLFYRVSVFPIRIPPLRQRREDIELLARHFVQRFAAKLRRSVVEIAEDALSRLREYDWPGNVRELQNVIERAVILSAGATIEARVLGIAAAAPGPTSATAPQRPLTLAEAERQAILAALEVTGWRISGRDGAAGVLGLKPTTLHAKMKKLGIRRPPRPASGSASGATTA